jgi:inosine-uridine nucleoside N-ribohydrolase
MSVFPRLAPDRREALLAEPTGPVDVVIDTDVTNEVDDQLAIVWALLRGDRLRLHGLYACPYGWDGPRRLGGGLTSALGQRRLRARMAQQGLSAADLPVLDPAEGHRRALEELHRIVDLAGAPTDLALGGVPGYLPGPAEPVECPAVDHLIELSHAERDGPLYVLAIGGATNVASALLTDPTLVERIVVVWTSAYPSFWPEPNASFNLAQDLHASRVLLDSGVPLVYLPGYYVGEQLRTTFEEVRAHMSGKGPLGDYLVEVCARHSMSDGPPGTSKVMWDLINVAWVLEPEWLVTKLVATPGLGPDLRWQARPDAPLMREAVDIDRDAVFVDLYARLAAAAIR